MDMGMNYVGRVVASGILLMMASTSQAVMLSGEGYGATSKEARSQALSALSESIRVEVKSELSTHADSDGYDYVMSNQQSISDLPLLGADVTVYDKRGEFYGTALLNSDTSLPLYQEEIERQRKSLEGLKGQLDAAKGDPARRYALLTQALAEMEEYEKHRAVFFMLSGTSAPAAALDASQLKSDLMSIEAAAPSLSIAAQMIARELPSMAYAVKPAMPHGARRATSLSRLLRDELASQVELVDDARLADATLKGSYEVLSDAVVVSYAAVSSDGTTFAKRVVKLAPEAYRGVDYKPKSVDFDTLLHEGYVVSSDFRAELRTQDGADGLLYQRGDTVELFVKLNAPGYFYIVSHNADEHYSYLLELGDGRGDRAFVTFVNADDANRWLSLGEFEVSPPFGAENLQLIASSEDLVGKLPRHRYDSRLDLHTVEASGNKEAVMKTRALRPKRSNKVRSAEASLTLTTME